MIGLFPISLDDDLVGVLPLSDRLALRLPDHGVQEGRLHLQQLPGDLIWGAHYQLSAHNTQGTLNTEIFYNSLSEMEST